MTVVEECLGKPGMIPVTATLWGGVSGIVGYHQATDTLVSTVSTMATGDDGCWSLDLIPNDQLEPAGTTWRIERDDFPSGRQDYISFISVPATGGPLQAWDLQVSIPDVFSFPLFIPNLIIGNSLIVNGVDLTPISLSSLPSATEPLDGAELLAMEQDNFGVKVTSHQLVASPLESVYGKTRNRIRGFEDFETLAGTFSTDGGIHAGGKVTYAFSGTGSGITQDQGLGVIGSGALSTGTTTTGRAGLTSSQQVFHLFDPAVDFAFGAVCKVPVISDGTNTYLIRIGFMNTISGVPTDGAYFQSPAGAGNWQAIVRDDNADAASTGTGVAYDANGAYHTFVIKHISGTGFRYWIDGTPVVTHASTNLDTGAAITMRGVLIIKSAGTTARAISVDTVSWDHRGVDANVKIHNMP